MENRFDELMSSIKDIQFKETSPEELENLLKLFGGKIPDTLLDFFQKHMPADRTKFRAGYAFVFYGIEEIIEENTNTVPGSFLFPMGLYTFASFENGDCACFDANDPAFPVYACSRRLLKGGDEIPYHDGKRVQTLPYEYKNVLKVSKCLGSSFEEFVTNITKWEKEDELEKLIDKAYRTKLHDQVVAAFEAHPDVELTYLRENYVIASYNNLKKYDKALAVLDQYKHRFENRMRVWYYYAGYAYVGKEDCEKAEECIKAGIDECNREKKAKILKGKQYENEVGDFIYFQWQCQRIKALRFLKDNINSDSKLPEIVRVFREMSQKEFEYEDEAQLLFEASVGKENTYAIHLVRQTELLQYEEYYQLTVDVEYEVNQQDIQNNTINDLFCNQNQDGDIFEYIDSSQAYALFKDLKPVRIIIEEVDIEDCVAEKDIKQRNNGSLSENLTINKKPVSNEDEIMALLNDDIVELEMGDNCLYIEFSEEGHAFIGWIDTYNEENYYFDNGSGNTESVDLLVNVCPEERMMCYDPNALKEIVLYFCRTGQRNPNYNWIEDTF